ncbi:hypothetical protein [Polaribacter butkevichii]|uniref:Outer membrane protein beta-barrel domain-containing protein n=1 Tax=Polaribacter butkevichii TaxID=218490 RepID=A0A2P6C706_9FLAO|nr:hypothetical protein [Polaribacter butkevichii]PQJ68719.1 hypothetical protein BTO14_11740 [Polaribacter butkevichii]
MKKIITAIFLSAFFVTYSQENKNTVDVFGLKAGLIGGWVSYEKALSNNFTLNSEVGYEGGFLKGTNDKVDYVFTTVFSLEPRFYYNLKKREDKGKKTKNNSANYISSEFFYVPDLLSSSNRENLNVNKSFGIIPKYGLRRSVSDNLIFEFAIGAGYAWGENEINGITAALDLRFNLKL